jgi:hypothetical protein
VLRAKALGLALPVLQAMMRIYQMQIQHSVE